MYYFSTDVFVVPSKWQTRDIKPRTHGHDCYYATLAGLKQTTIEELVEETGIPDNPNGAIVTEIERLYTAANYPGKFVHFLSKDEVKDYVCSNLFANPELGLRLAVGYQISDSEGGHVVALIAYIIQKGKKKGQPTYHVTDFQKDANDRLKEMALPEGVYYWLWETSQRYYRKETQNQ